MKNYKVWLLDVWGNQSEYWVNDRREITTIAIPDPESNQSVFDALVKSNIIGKDKDFWDFDFDGEIDMFYVDFDGMPALQLESC